MRLLPKVAHERAVEFLESRARPLDLALYRHHFDAGSADVPAELAAFQNPDGGFGHALEPDLRLPNSSVIATTVALQVLREINAAANNPLVRSACGFLRDTYDSTNVNWINVPANLDEAPHAPWWRFDPNPAKEPSNPRAEIAGYLLDYAEHFPHDMRKTVTAAVVDHLFEHGGAAMEMHDLLCYLRFYESRNMAADEKATIHPILTVIVNKTVERNPGSWSTYGIQPLKVVSTPDSPFAEGFASLLDQNLDILIDTQADDGAWYPNWSWADAWPEAWARARVEWAGHITVNTLKTLGAFGRLYS